MLLGFSYGIMIEIVNIDYNREWISMLIGSVTSATIFTACWFSIWLLQNPMIQIRRRLLSLISIPIGVIAALALGGFSKLAFNESEFSVIFGTLAYPISVVLTCCLIWRQRAGERAAYLASVGIGMIHCPGCGYNLSQQIQASCPECGRESTLNELVAHTARKIIEP